jgi:hypothetical protein
LTDPRSVCGRQGMDRGQPTPPPITLGAPNVNASEKMRFMGLARLTGYWDIGLSNVENWASKEVDPKFLPSLSGRNPVRSFAHSENLDAGGCCTL